MQTEKSFLTCGRMAEGEAFKLLKCSICSKTLDEPRVLPACSHSFCTRCLRTLFTQMELANRGSVSRKLTCPNCRKVSEIPIQQHRFRAVENFGLNFSAKRCTEVLAKAKCALRNATMSYECPHIPYFERDGHLCQHCSKSFCGTCLISHKEILRLELNSMIAGFEERKTTLVGKDFDTRLEEARKHVGEMVKSAELKALQDAETAIEAIKVGIYTNRDRLMAEAREIGEKELKTLAEKLPRDRAMVEQANYAGQMEKINDDSILSLEIQQLANLHKEVQNIDSKIRDLENFHVKMKEKSISYEPIQEPVSSITSCLKAASVRLEEGEKDSTRQIIPSETRRLHVAAEKGDLATLKQILTRENLPRDCQTFLANARNPATNKTPLMEAAKSGSLECTKFLVEELGADLYMGDEFENMAIHEAATFGHLPIVKYLLSRAPDHRKAFKGLLHVACYQGSLEIVRFLVEEINWPVDDTDSANGTTPLFDTIYSGGGKLEIVKFLVEHGAKIDFRNKEGDMAIHGATENGYDEVFAFLLEKRPDFKEARDHLGRTPLLIVSGLTYGKSVTEKDRERLKISEEEIEDPNLDPGDVEKVDYERGAALSTLKHQRGCLKIAQILLEKEANLDAYVPTTGFMPVHCSAQSGNVEILRKFLEKGNTYAFSKTYGEKDLAPLQVCTDVDNENYSGAVVRCLVGEFKSQIYQARISGTGTLLDVAEHGDLDTFKYLVLEEHADMGDEAPDSGVSVLHNAIYSGQLDLVKFIIDREPLLLNRSSEEGTPLRFAIESKADPAIVQVLLSKNAKLGDEDDNNGDILIGFGDDEDSEDNEPDEAISSDDNDL